MKVRYVIKFTKGENIKFIGHLDLMRTIQRIIKRSGLPVEYSKGFNPHMALSIAQPLSVGVYSDGEYLDLVLTESLGVGEVIEKLNKVYDVYICSGCVIFNCPKESAPIFMYKYNCLIRNFPFIHPFKFIFTQTKDVVDADIIIDDNPNYLKKEREIKILFDSYHNRNLTDEYLKENNIVRAKSWKEIENILLK